MRMATPELWLGKLGKLKIDRARGDPAPHKPLLLLAVIELAEQGLLPPAALPLSPELAFRFCTFWSVVAHRRRQRPDVRLPFHHLQSDGVWSARTEEGVPSPDYRLTRFATLPSDFAAFANDPGSRDKARRILIAKYFQPEERLALYALFGMPVPADDQIRRDAQYRPPEEARRRGREARFRVSVVAAYNYTCALTGYRLTTITGASLVDGAHIHQFADSRNNEVGNGLALCKNAHWLFDNGLWTLTDNYRVIVAVGRFCEAASSQKGLTLYHGESIQLPHDKTCWPDPIHIAWHRKHKFQGH
jgi:putative restriction endonuclease